MVWKRVPEYERQGVIGWFEDEKGNIMTMTDGIVHVAFRGQVFAVVTPPETYSTNIGIIAKKVAEQLKALSDRMDGLIAQTK